jgi:hypothetical protein
MVFISSSLHSLEEFYASPLSEQSIAQTVVDGLDLSVVLQSVGAELTAQTGLLEATEGSLVGDHVVVVDPDGTGLEGVGDTDGGVDVLGVDGSGET